MARQAKPWFWEQKKCWYVTINGKRTRLSKDKQEALDKFYELKANEKDNANKDYLVVLMDDMVDWTKKNRSAGTYRFYHEHAQQFVEFLKEENQTAIECKDVNPDFFEKYLDSLSVGRRNGAVQTIKRVFNWGLKRGRIKVNPIMALEKPSSGRRQNYITNKVYGQMLKASSDQNLEDLLIFCWETGCRPQEAWRLKEEHVEIKYQRCRLPLEKTKRKKMDRTIYCTDKAWKIVLRLNSNGYLFSNRAGTPWNKDNIGKRMAQLAGHLDKRYALYDIRHTWITNKVKAGVDVHMIAKLAGTSVAMIEKYYDHSDEDAKFMLSVVKQIA